MQQLQQQEDPAAGVLAVAQLELCRSCQQVVQEQEPMFALHRLWVTCRQHLIGHRDSGLFSVDSRWKSKSPPKRVDKQSLNHRPLPAMQIMRLKLLGLLGQGLH